MTQRVKVEGGGARKEEKGSSTSTALLVVSLSVFWGQAGTLDSDSTRICWAASLRSATGFK